jgi:hypothetical protein
LLGEVLRQEGRDHDAAEPARRNALVLKPQNAVARQNLGGLSRDRRCGPTKA